jgi:NAD(P)-dependent dehydrogenase (short-subunit alcohol dehydrogenase family)
VSLLPCDVTDEASLALLADSIAAAGGRLNLVINTAGLLHDAGLAPEKTVRQVTLANLQRAFTANAFGPILLARALLPQLATDEPVVFASLSARVGSIGDNRLGGWYAYRASKAAQNQLLRSFAIEFARLNRRAIVLALHPGTVDTALSQPFSGGVAADKLFTPAFAAQRLLDVIAARTPADSGGFYAWDGAPIPW